MSRAETHWTADGLCGHAGAALERARLRQASRLLNSDESKVSKQDLVLIKPEGIAQSRVFQDDSHEAGRDDDRPAPQPERAEA